MSIYERTDDDRLLTVSANTGSLGKVTGDFTILPITPLSATEGKFFGHFMFALPLEGTLDAVYTIAEYTNTGAGGDLFITITTSTDIGDDDKLKTKLRVENTASSFVSDFLIDINTYRIPELYYYYVDFLTPANSYVGCSSIPSAAFDSVDASESYLPVITTSTLFQLPVGCIIGRYVFNFSASGGPVLPPADSLKRAVTERIIKLNNSLFGSLGSKGENTSIDTPMEFIPLTDANSIANEAYPTGFSYTMSDIAFTPTFYIPYRARDPISVSGNSITINADLTTKKITGSFKKIHNNVTSAFFITWLRVVNLAIQERIDLFAFTDGEGNKTSIGTTFLSGTGYEFDVRKNDEHVLESTESIGSAPNVWQHVMFFYDFETPGNSLLMIDGELAAMTAKGAALSTPVDGIEDFELFGGAQSGVKYAHTAIDFNNSDASQVMAAMQGLIISRAEDAMTLGMKARNLSGRNVSAYFPFNAGITIIDEVSGVAATIAEGATFTIVTNDDVRIGE